MKKKKVIFTIILLGLVVAIVFLTVAIKQRSPKSFSEVDPGVSNFATGGDIDESSREYDRLGSSGGYTPVILNVNNCQAGRDSVYFGLGHTEFLVKGKKGGKCIFDHGTEVENPRWDGVLDTNCSVPTAESIKLTIDDQGIDFTTIKQFCSSS